MRELQNEHNISKSSISTRNQTVIPSNIRQKLGVKPGQKLSWRLIWINDKTKAIVEPEPESWAAHSRGLGKHLWEKVDIKQYLKQLRAEWRQN